MFLNFVEERRFLKNLRRDFRPCLGVVDFSPGIFGWFWLGEFVPENDADMLRDLRLRKLVFLKQNIYALETSIK